MIFRSSLLFSSLVAALPVFFVAVPGSQAFDGCNAAPTSSLVVNVKDRGAKGDGQTDDTTNIQKAIDAVAGTGGTVYVPAGTYMVRPTGKRRLYLKSKMTLKLSDGAVLKAIPTEQDKYSVLWIANASDVAVIGGTLQGDRAEHKGKGGEWGMGIRIGPDASGVTIAGVTAKDMWGDGFYVEGAKDIALCSVVAVHNRRQGLSIVEANRLLVTNSVFRDTRGTRPSAGIDIEPDKPEQKVANVRIEHSKFINNAGGGVMIAGKRGTVGERGDYPQRVRGGAANSHRERTRRPLDRDLRQPAYRKAGAATGRAQRLCRDCRGRLLARRLPGRARPALRDEPGKHEEEKKKPAN